MPIFPIKKPEAQQSSKAYLPSQCSPKWNVLTAGMSSRDEKKLEHIHFILILKREKFNFSKIPFAEWHCLLHLAPSQAVRHAPRTGSSLRNSGTPHSTRMAARASASFHLHGAPCSPVRLLGKASLWLLPLLTKITLTKWMTGLKKKNVCKESRGCRQYSTHNQVNKKMLEAATSAPGGSSSPAMLGAEHKDKPIRSDGEMTKKL